MTSVSSLPPVLRRVALCMSAMMVASCVFTFGMTHLLHLTRTMYGFAWISDPYLWCDFHVFQDQSLHFRTPAYWDDFGYPFTYPATDGVIFGLLFRLRHPAWAYFALLVVGSAAWLVWMTRGLVTRGIRMEDAGGFALVILASSWPFYYLLDTGNIEGMVVMLLGLGVLAVLRGWAWTGAVLIAFAGAMKIYPILLLALLFSKRRYNPLAGGIALAMGFTVGSLAILGPGIRSAQAHLNVGIDFLRRYYIVPRGSVNLNFSHALFNPLRFSVLLVDRVLYHGGRAASPAHEQALLDGSLRGYLVSIAVLAVWLYFGRIRKLPMLNQVIALVVSTLVLTPFSSDYTLLHLLVPFGLLCFYTVECWREGRTLPGLQTCFACFCFIMAFATFFTWKYAFASSIRALALCVLLVTVLRFPYRWTELDGPAPVAAASNGMAA
jgi:hypothetical protein